MCTKIKCQFPPLIDRGTISQADMRKNRVKMVPPDGGWGWLIVLGSSLINISTRGIEASFGLLFGDLLKSLGVATTGASIVLSTLNAVINFSGLFMGPLLKKFSYRKVAIIGSLLISTALFLTTYANSMLHLLITFGLIGGVGFGLATASTLVGINSYFSKKKGQAVGLAMAGTALGFMAMPQLVSYLLSTYDFRSSLLILAAFSLHAVAGSLLFQPVKWHLRPIIPVDDITREEALTILLSSDRKMSLHDDRIKESSVLTRKLSGPNLTTQFAKTSSFPILKRKPSVISNVSHVDLTGSTIHIEFDKNINEEEEEEEQDDSGIKISKEKVQVESQTVPQRVCKNKNHEEKTTGCWSKFYKLFDLNLLADGVYLNILYGVSITVVAEMNFKLVVPFFLENLGYSKKEVAMALSLMAVADILARVSVPPILDRLTCSRKATLIFGSFLVALCRSLFAEQTETVPLMIFLVIHGFFRGMTLINFPLVLSEYATGDNFPAVLGLSMVSKGIFVVILGPVAGIVRDATQSYPMYVHCQSLMLLTMVLAWGVELLFFPRSKKVETDIPANV